jgi:Tfp pilus assembly protein FimV
MGVSSIGHTPYDRAMARHSCVGWKGVVMAAGVARRAVWLLLSAVLIAACGGGDGESDAEQASPAPSAAAQEEPSSAPSQPPDSDAGEGGGDGAGDSGQTYVVRSGDTLSAIAQRFDTTVQAIVRANDISDPDIIDVGQRLRIPGG